MDKKRSKSPGCSLLIPQGIQSWQNNGDRKKRVFVSNVKKDTEGMWKCRIDVSFKKRKIFFGSDPALLGHCTSLSMARGVQCLYIANKAPKNPKFYVFTWKCHLCRSSSKPRLQCKNVWTFVKVIAFIVIQDQSLILFFLFHCTVVQNKFTRSRFFFMDY